MAKNNTVKVTILGDARNVSKAFAKAGHSADGFGKKMVGFSKKVGALSVVAIGAFALVGKKALELGITLDQTMRKSEVVLGDQLATVQKWSSGIAGAMGLTSTELTGLTAGFADLLIPMGFAREEGAQLAMDVVGLSGALSAWTNNTQSAAEVADILSKAMLGEREGLKALGISITEADVQARLAENGTKALTGAALQQAKAIATQELIFEKTTDAQTAYADGQDSLLIRTNKMKAGFKEMRETLLLAFLPIIERMAKLFGDKLVPALKSAAEWFEKNADAMGASFDSMRERLADAWRAVRQFGDGLWEQLKPAREAITKFVAFFGTLSTGMKATLSGTGLIILAGLSDVVAGVAGWLAARLAILLATLASWPALLVIAIVGGIASAFLYFGPELDGPLGDIQKKLRSWVDNKIMPWIHGAAGQLREAIKTWLPVFVDWTQSLWANIKVGLSSMPDRVINWIKSTGAGWSRNMINVWIPAFTDWMRRVGPELGTKFGLLVVAFVKGIPEAAVKINMAMASWIAAAINWVAEAARSFSLGELLGAIRGAANASLDMVGGFFRSFGTVVGAALWDGITAVSSSAWTKLRDAGQRIAKAVANGFISMWNKLDPKINVSLPGWLGGGTFNSGDMIPDIPYLAAGGIVTQPTLAMVGEAGPEVVIPLSKLNSIGSGGAQIINLVVDGAVLASVVNRRNSLAI
tara:strand:- start:5520 stop:7610 length:2091 start_codon:yes stop_codon:yes gene_type:complete